MLLLVLPDKQQFRIYSLQISLIKRVESSHPQNHGQKPWNRPGLQQAGRDLCVPPALHCQTLFGAQFLLTENPQQPGLAKEEQAKELPVRKCLIFSVGILKTQLDVILLCLTLTLPG